MCCAQLLDGFVAMSISCPFHSNPKPMEHLSGEARMILCSPITSLGGNIVTKGSKVVELRKLYKYGAKTTLG